MSQSRNRYEASTLIPGASRTRCLVRRLAKHVELTMVADTRKPELVEVAVRLTPSATRRLISALAESLRRAESDAPVLVEIVDLPAPPPVAPPMPRDGEIRPPGVPKGRVCP